MGYTALRRLAKITCESPHVFLNSKISFLIIFAVAINCFLVVPRPRVRRRLFLTRSAGRPSACKTCDGSNDPEVQAEPEDAAMPAMSRRRSKDSASTP